MLAAAALALLSNKNNAHRNGNANCSSNFALFNFRPPRGICDHDNGRNQQSRFHSEYLHMRRRYNIFEHLKHRSHLLNWWRRCRVWTISLFSKDEGGIPNVPPFETERRRGLDAAIFSRSSYISWALITQNRWSRPFFAAT